MATKVLDKARLQHSRDTSANWTQYNPVLLDGEIIIVDTDAGEVRYKVGDGTKHYSQLPFDDEAIRVLINNAKINGVTITSPAMTASSGVCTWTITHNLNKPVTYTMIDTASNEEVMASMTVTNANTLTAKFASASNIAAGKYKIIIVGCEVSA